MAENTQIDDFNDDFSDEDKSESSLEFWKFKDQKEVIGFFKRWEKDNYGEHAVVLTSGSEETHLPNLMALNSKLKNANVQDGNKIKIVSLGEKKSEKSGRLYEDFDVFVKNTL